MKAMRSPQHLLSLFGLYVLAFFVGAGILVWAVVIPEYPVPAFAFALFVVVTSATWKTMHPPTAGSHRSARPTGAIPSKTAAKTLHADPIKDLSRRRRHLHDQDFSGRLLPKIDLSGGDLSRSDLTGAVMEKAKLRRAQLLKTIFVRANLYGADLRAANLTGAHLDNASLTQANLGGANLTNASLVDAHLLGADLRGAILDGAKFDRAKINGTTLCDDYRYLVERGADMTDKPHGSTTVGLGVRVDRSLFDSRTDDEDAVT